MFEPERKALLKQPHHFFGQATHLLLVCTFHGCCNVLNTLFNRCLHHFFPVFWQNVFRMSVQRPK